MQETRLNNKIAEIADFIAAEEEFLLLGHEDADGDCIGSLAGLAYLLKGLGKNPVIAIYQPVPEMFQLAIADELQLLDASEQLPEIASVIVLDSSGQDRLGPAADILESRTVLNIDHHEDNDFFGDLNYVRPEAAAAGLIIYDLAVSLGWKINEKAARALALAILSDTGFFRYSNTDTQTLAAVQELMDLGADIHRINRALYGQNKPEAMRLLGRGLSRIEVCGQGKVAYFYLDREDYRTTGTTSRDNEGFVNFARNISGVEVGIFFSEESDCIKVSFRSNDYLRVNDIAASFGGGGHPRAAGCKVAGDLERVINEVINEVEKHV